MMWGVRGEWFGKLETPPPGGGVQTITACKQVPESELNFFLGRRAKCGHLEDKTFHLVSLILSL